MSSLSLSLLLSSYRTVFDTTTIRILRNAIHQNFRYDIQHHLLPTVSISGWLRRTYVRLYEECDPRAARNEFERDERRWTRNHVPVLHHCSSQCFLAEGHISDLCGTLLLLVLNAVLHCIVGLLKCAHCLSCTAVDVLTIGVREKVRERPHRCIVLHPTEDASRPMITEGPSGLKNESNR